MNKPRIYRQNGLWAVERAEPSSAEFFGEYDCANNNIRAAEWVLWRNQITLIAETFAVLPGKAAL